MTLALRIYPCLLVLLGITLLTSANLTITASNTLDDGSFALNSMARLTCTNQPYSGSQTWTVDSVSVADCGLILCVENSSNTDRYSFLPNTSTGIFEFYIDSVLLTDDSKVIGCYDGSVITNFTLKVKASLTISASNTLDDGSFEHNSLAQLTCINQPYSGSQTWTVNSVSVADCGLILCVENVSNTDRYSFLPNVSTGIFNFYIDPVLLTDNNNVIGCYDGSVTTYFTLKVEVSGEGGTADDGLSTLEYVLIVVMCTIAVTIMDFCIFFWLPWCQSHIRQGLVNKGLIEPPTNLRCVEDRTTDSSVKLLWERGFSKYPNQTFILSYKNERVKDCKEVTVTGNDKNIQGATVEYVLENLDHKSEYSVKVRSENKDGMTNDTRAISCFTHGLIEPPTNLRCVEDRTTDSSVKLLWERGFSKYPNQTFILSYKNERVKDCKEVTVTGNDKNIQGATVEYVLENLDHKSEYSVKVRSENKDGMTNDTRAISCFTHGLLEPPTSFQYIEDSITDSSVTLTWKSGFSRKSVQTFILRYKTLKAKIWTKELVDGCTDNSCFEHTIFDLTPLSKYLVKVRAKNEDGETDDTEDISFETHDVILGAID